jgi:hypothetical protein
MSPDTMDRIISMAWRALYVTVGACAVLVAQSVAQPDAVATVDSQSDPLAAPPALPASPAPRALSTGRAPVAVGMPTREAETTPHVAVGRWLSTVATPVPPRTAAGLACAAGRAQGSC